MKYSKVFDLKSSVFVLLLAVVGMIINACGGSSPTAPQATATPVPPTATYTPCGFPGNTCTYTYTSTQTFTNTWTNTFSPTSTPTMTYTPTVTYTPTQTFTATLTYTPSNTFTSTFSFTPSNTPTITNTPTLTYTPTITYTPTNTNTSTFSGTPTNTATMTNTPTITDTPTVTNSPTPTPTGIVITGNVSYTGSQGTVSSTDYIAVDVYNNNELVKGSNGVSLMGAATITSNGGSFSIPISVTGTFYVLVNFNYSGYGNGVDQGGPMPGEPYAIVTNTTGGTTGSTPAPGIAFSGATNLGSISFGDSYFAYGVAAPVTYTAGSSYVTSTNAIHYLAYAHGTNTLLTEGEAKTLPSKYTLTFLNSQPAIDIVAFWDKEGSASLQATPQADDPQATYSNVSTNGTVGAPISAPSIVLTPVFTITPTNTPSPTFTFTSTPTFSPTVDPYVIKGTIQYTGSDSVAGQYLLMMGTTCINCGSGTNASWVTNGTKSVCNYTLDLPSTGNYVIFAILSSVPNFNNTSPPVGASYSFYGGACLTSGTPTTIAISGPTTQTVNWTFGDSCVLDGIGGTISYTGVGAVNNNNGLVVDAYLDSNYSTPVPNNNSAYVTVSGGTYNLINTSGTPSNVYLQAYYNSNQGNGGGNGPVTGDPVTNLGLVAFNTVLTNKNITLNDSYLYNSTNSLTGTVNYSGTGTVSASDPIVVRAVTFTGSFLQQIGACAVTSNGGTYFFGLPASGNYYLTEEFVAVPGAHWDDGDYAVGSYAQNSDGSCVGSGSGPNGSSANPIVVSGATNSNLSFNSSCGQFQGYTGTLNYTGSMGTPSCSSTSHQIWVQAVDGTSESANTIGNSTGVCDNGDTYYLNIGTTSGSYYLRAWYDSNGVGCCQPQSGESWTVVGPYSSSANPSAVNISFADGQSW
jgi:hypothetical protein